METYWMVSAGWRGRSALFKKQALPFKTKWSLTCDKKGWKKISKNIKYGPQNEKISFMAIVSCTIGTILKETFLSRRIITQELWFISWLSADQNVRLIPWVVIYAHNSIILQSSWRISWQISIPVITYIMLLSHVEIYSCYIVFWNYSSKHFSAEKKMTK